MHSIAVWFMVSASFVDVDVDVVDVVALIRAISRLSVRRTSQTTMAGTQTAHTDCRKKAFPIRNGRDQESAREILVSDNMCATILYMHTRLVIAVPLGCGFHFHLFQRGPASTMSHLQLAKSGGASHGFSPVPRRASFTFVCVCACIQCAISQSTRGRSVRNRPTRPTHCSRNKEITLHMLASVKPHTCANGVAGKTGYAFSKNVDPKRYLIDTADCPACPTG